MFGKKKGSGFGRFDGFTKFAQDAIKGTQETIKASEQFGSKMAQKAAEQVAAVSAISSPQPGFINASSSFTMVIF